MSTNMKVQAQAETDDLYDLTAYEIIEQDFLKWTDELYGCFADDKAVTHFCEKFNLSKNSRLSKIYWAFLGGYGYGVEFCEKLDELSQQKRCGSLQSENEKLAKRTIQSERAARDIASAVDAIIAQITIHYGDKAFDPDEPDKQVGYRITVPAIAIETIMEKYEVRATKNEKDDTYVMAVTLRDDPEDHRRDGK